LQADRLPEAPLHSIADHGFTQGFRDREADLGPLFLLGLLKAECSKKWAGKAETLIIDFTEVATAKNSEGLRKRKLGQWPNSPDDSTA
jgi:hypothetical protein